MSQHTVRAKLKLRNGYLAHRSRLSVLIYLAPLLILLSIAPKSLFAQRYGPQSRDRMITFPLSAPHLTKKMIDRQTRSLNKRIKKSRVVTPISLGDVKAGVREQRFNLNRLKRPVDATSDVYRLCIRLQTKYALSVQMKLGTDRQPARLIGAIFFCRSTDLGIERFELPFEGRLSKRVWRLFTEQLSETLSRPRKPRQSPSRSERRPPSQFTTTITPNTRPQTSPQYPRIQPREPQMAPMAPMSAPNVERRTMIPMPRAEPPPVMSSPESMMTESSRFLMTGGPRFLTKSFSYQTATESRVLKGGLSYDSQWLIGWGGNFLFRPFSGDRQLLRGLTLRGSFSRFSYDSIRVIRSPFDPPIKVKAPSDLSRWSGGFAFAYPLRTARQAHQIGFSLMYYGELMNLTPNPEYLGLDLHLIDLSLFGEFVLSPGSLYLNLEGGIRPFASHGNRVTELGSSAESYGGASSIGVRYRSPDGLTLSFKLQLAVLFSTPIGEGRGGRVGTEAKDQTISLGLDLGYSSNPKLQ